MLSCGLKTRPCVPSVKLANPNSELCPDPASMVVLLDVPRVDYGAMHPTWLARYSQAAATGALQTAGVAPMTASQGTAGVMAVESTRVLKNTMGTALIGNTGLGECSAVVGARVMASSDQTFVPAVHKGYTLQRLGNTGYTAIAPSAASTSIPFSSASSTTSTAAPSVPAAVNSFAAILSSPVPVGMQQPPVPATLYP